MKSTANLATIWAGAESARVAVLASKVLKIMFLQRLKLKVLSLSMIALVAAGAGSLVWRATSGHAGGGSGGSDEPGEAGGGRHETQRTGKIYITAERGTRGVRGEAASDRLMAVDPQTGEKTDILDGCSMRPRVSPDGKLVAFERENALWVRGLDPNAEPRKVIELGGRGFGVAARLVA